MAEDARKPALLRAIARPPFNSSGLGFVTPIFPLVKYSLCLDLIMLNELELELTISQMAKKPQLRACAACIKKGEGERRSARRLNE